MPSASPGGHDDPVSAEMFAVIGRDERYHVAYSRAALERLAAPEEIEGALRRVARRRLRGLWMGAGLRVVQVLGRLWMGLVYLLLLAPFAVLARLLERPVAGLQPPPGPGRPAERAHRAA